MICRMFSIDWQNMRNSAVSECFRIDSHAINSIGKCNMFKILKLFVVFISIFTGSAAFASSGFVVTYQGAKASGMADAFIAQADDPSANYYNPAGLASIEGTQFSTGVILAYQTPWEFDGSVNDGTGNFIETSEEARSNVLVAPHIYFSHRFENKLAVGFGLTASYPLSVAWSPNDLLSNYSHENNMLPLTFNPNIAYKFDNIGLSIGAGISYTYVIVSQENLLPANALGAGSPATYSRAELTGDGWGYNLGIKWEANDMLTLAATYRGKIHVDLEGDIKGTSSAFTGSSWTGYLDQDIDADVNLPAMAVFGVAVKPLKNLVIEFDAARTYFSSYTGPFGDWEDVWGYRLGGQYSINENWDVRAGYAYEENPVPGDVVGPDLPDSDCQTVTVGFGYHNERFAFDMSLGNMRRQSRKVDNDIQKGTYKLDVPFSQMTVTMKF